MSADPRLSTCVLCPRLCRAACPVATGSAREAAVPAVIAGVLREWGEGRLPAAVAAEAAALCVDCGACQRHCHLDRPLPSLIVDARSALAAQYGARQPDPLVPIEGSAPLVAVCTDERPFAEGLGRALGTAVARWRTADRLGAAGTFAGVRSDAHLARVKAHARGRQIVVADGGVAEILTAAEVPFAWVSNVVPSVGGTSGSCRAGGTVPLACCGGAGPLPVVHPADAARVGRAWVASREDASGCDTRCRDHLRAIGAEASDAVDALLAKFPP